METLKFIAKNFGLSFLIAAVIGIANALLLEKTQMPVSSVFWGVPFLIIIGLPMGMSLPITRNIEAIINGHERALEFETLLVLILSLAAYVFSFFAIRFKKVWFGQPLIITAFLIWMYFGIRIMVTIT